MDEMDRQAAINPKVQNRRRKNRKILLVLLLLVLLAAAAGGVYVWQQKKISSLNNAHKEEVSTLNSTIEALKNEIASQNKKTSASDDSTENYGAVKDAVKKAVEGTNYTELSKRMASPVNIIIAASEGIGARTPEQAVEDLKYLNNAKGTWTFDVPSAKLTSWRSGDYGQYVPENGIIGLSSDGYVVTFKLNTQNKITDIFMAADENLM